MEIRKESEDITVFRYTFHVSLINALLNIIVQTTICFGPGSGLVYVITNQMLFTHFGFPRIVIFSQKWRTLYSCVYFVLVMAGVQDCDATCATPIN
jgi:hypothetical protein